MEAQTPQHNSLASNGSSIVENNPEMQEVLQNDPSNFNQNVYNTQIYQEMVKMGNEDEIAYDGEQSETLKQQEFSMRNRKANMTKTLNEKKRTQTENGNGNGNQEETEQTQETEEGNLCYSREDMDILIENPVFTTQERQITTDNDTYIDLDKYGTIQNTKDQNDNDGEVDNSSREKIVFYWSWQDPSKSCGTLRAFSEDEYVPQENGLVPAGAIYTISKDSDLKLLEMDPQKNVIFRSANNNSIDWSKNEIVETDLKDTSKSTSNLDKLSKTEDVNMSSQETLEKFISSKNQNPSNPIFVKELLLAGRRCLQDEEGNLWEIYAEEDVSNEQELGQSPKNGYRNKVNILPGSPKPSKKIKLIEGKKTEKKKPPKATTARKQYIKIDEGLEIPEVDEEMQNDSDAYKISSDSNRINKLASSINTHSRK